MFHKPHDFEKSYFEMPMAFHMGSAATGTRDSVTYTRLFPNTHTYAVGDTVYTRGDFDKKYPLLVEEIGPGFVICSAGSGHQKLMAGEVSKSPISKWELYYAKVSIERILDDQVAFSKINKEVIQ